jgi:hypothetical protein
MSKEDSDWELNLVEESFARAGNMGAAMRSTAMQAADLSMEFFQ